MPQQRPGLPPHASRALSTDQRALGTMGHKVNSTYLCLFLLLSKVPPKPQETNNHSPNPQGPEWESQPWQTEIYTTFWRTGDSQAVPDLTAGSRRLSACSVDTMNHAGFLDINWGKNTHRNGKETAKLSPEECEKCLRSTFSSVTGLDSGLLESGSPREHEV